MGVDDFSNPPLQRALDPQVYYSSEAFEIERQRIFSSSWRLIGHENMLKAEGDYLTDDIAGASIVAIRTADDGIKAFHNVCRHRAGPLATNQAGNCGKELTCKYHGWRYALDGRLRSARDFGRTEGFDPRKFSLYPVHLVSWRGFLFASLSDDAPPVEDELSGVAEQFSGLKIHPFALRRSHVISCNWKAYVENYLEGYHVPDVHPGLDKDIDAASYKVEMNGSAAIHHAPPKGCDGVYAGFWAWLWPWLGVNLYRDGLMMERISPVSPSKTRLDYLYFFDPDKLDELNAMIKMSDEVTAEDKFICEAVQVNLEAGAYQPGPLSPKHEVAVGWFQNRLRELLGYG